MSMVDTFSYFGKPLHGSDGCVGEGTKVTLTEQAVIERWVDRRTNVVQAFLRCAGEVVALVSSERSST